MELVSCQPPDDFLLPGVLSFNALMGLSCYMLTVYSDFQSCGFNALMGLSCYANSLNRLLADVSFNALMGLSCYVWYTFGTNGRKMFQCPHGLELLLAIVRFVAIVKSVSMPSWA